MEAHQRFFTVAVPSTSAREDCLRCTPVVSLLRHCQISVHSPSHSCDQPQMDALLDAINIRDLLSGHDLSDPTTPLSAPDLRLLINRLDSHSLRIKSKVQSYLLAHHSDFSSLFSLCHDAVARTGQISNGVSEVLGLVNDSPIDVEIRGVLDETTGTMRELKVKRELLDLVKAIAGIYEGLKDAREGLKDGQLKSAAQRLRDLRVVLRIGNVEKGEPVVYGLLRKEWSDCFEEIQDLLAKLMDNAVRFEQESNKVRVKYKLDDGVELRTVLEAMEVIGVLDYGLAKVADLTIKHVFTPSVINGSSIECMDDLNQSFGERNEAILKLGQSSDAQIESVDGDALYTRILQIVKFFHDSLCFQNATWIRCLGKLTWPRISKLIISNFLAKVVPEDASKLADFQKVIKSTTEFEAALENINFISASYERDESLSNFANNVEVHFASRKKTEILTTARNLLLKCDFVVPQEYNSKNDGMTFSEQTVSLLFSSESCVISKAATQLMELVHRTLQDVCVSSSRVALEFYSAAKDSILLYEAVLPTKLQKQLAGINQVAILLHNDCVYLFEEILGLAFEYRADFPSSIKEYAVFADIAPRFKVMAEEILQRQIQLVISNLGEAIDGADGFQNTHQAQQFESAKFSIERVVFTLEKVHIIWEPLLMRSTYKRCMCVVLEAVFLRITRDILLLDDMAAEETFQLQKLIHLMMENLSSLLTSLISAEEASRPLDDLIPSLCKIRKLTELLDMPLKSITAAWENGELFSCGFTSAEVEDLVRAIFTDSPLRKECLWRIENASL